jgi:hypothetical protein
MFWWVGFWNLCTWSCIRFEIPHPFRESRDYVDILLSMKHQPNITVVDVANLVAAQKKERNIFSSQRHAGGPNIREKERKRTNLTSHWNG